VLEAALIVAGLNAAGFDAAAVAEPNVEVGAGSVADETLDLAFISALEAPKPPGRTVDAGVVRADVGVAGLDAPTPALTAASSASDLDCPAAFAAALAACAALSSAPVAALLSNFVPPAVVPTAYPCADLSIGAAGGLNAAGFDAAAVAASNVDGFAVVAAGLNAGGFDAAAVAASNADGFAVVVGVVGVGFAPEGVSVDFASFAPEGVGVRVLDFWASFTLFKAAISF
jgi:hypothetical protein